MLLGAAADSGAKLAAVAETQPHITDVKRHSGGAGLRSPRAARSTERCSLYRMQLSQPSEVLKTRRPSVLRAPTHNHCSCKFSCVGRCLL